MLPQTDLQVKHFFEQNNRFKTLQCQTTSEFWSKRSANHIIAHSDRYKQIQVNSQQLTQCLAFDIDHDDPMIYTDFNLPAPTIITLNKNNGRSHLLYYLKAPVNTHSDIAKNYLADIYDAVTNTLQADTNYSTYNTKNFLNTDLYRVYGSLETRELGDFREFLKIQPKKEKRPAISYFSRNCELFDTVRFYAYRVKRDFTSYESFFEHIHRKAQETNIGLFTNPLPYKEVRDTAKSISKWTWGNEVPGVWNWQGYTKKDPKIVSAKRAEIAASARRSETQERLKALAAERKKTKIREQNRLRQAKKRANNQA